MTPIRSIQQAVRDTRPLIHCITNPISIAQCANAILAVGARPMMAEHPREVQEITETAQALLLNLGNITDARMESMKLSMQTAKEKQIPVILDAVGVSCSTMRREYIGELVALHRPDIIKGNYSEITALYHADYRSIGVDAEDTLTMQEVSKTAKAVAGKYQTMILASGKTDLITDGQELICVHHGTPQLSQVTGTGCMLGALCACYLSVRRDLYAPVTACHVLGTGGERAATDAGSGTFLMRLMDELSQTIE